MKKDAYILLRQVLGLLGMLLPILVLGFGVLGDNKSNWYQSISATFYANSGPIFISLMGAVGLFLITYGGGDYNAKLDKVINRLAGTMALIIIFFPVSVPDEIKVGILNLPIKISNVIHCVSAGLFFALLAFNILYLFTKGGVNKTKWKVWRNRVYYICGWGIVLFMVNQVLTTILGIEWFTMVNEIFMLVFFGTAWLVKGQVFYVLNDKE